METVTVIIPTYNEADSIEPLFDRLEGVLSSAQYDIDVLVVDDDSTDGTADVVREVGPRYSFESNVIVRKKNHGLGESVVCGLKNVTSDMCVVMDADLQHPPETIPELLDGLSDGAEVVVGSRRAEGGEYGDWKLSRHIISRVGDASARLAVPSAREVSDPISGFFALEPSSIDVSSLSPNGFKILLEVLASDPELDVSEVGFEFSTREAGESKADSVEAVRFGEHLAELRLEASPVSDVLEPSRAVRMAEFAFIGGVGAIINTIVFLGVLHMNAHYLLAGLLAFGVAVQWNYFGNRVLTFDNSQPTDSELSQYARFNAVSIGGLVVYQIFLGFSVGLLSAPPEVSNIAAIVVASVWNYFGSESLAFDAT